MKEFEDDDGGAEQWDDAIATPGEKRPDPVFIILERDGGLVIDPSLIETLYEKTYFGSIDPTTGLLFLYPEEIMVFSERSRLIALKDGDLNVARALLPEIKTRWEDAGFSAFASDLRFLTTEELFRHFTNTAPDFWDMYVVYRDLKIRGYIVRRGIKDVSHFRVYKKGMKKDVDTAKFIYFGVFEGRPVPLSKLHEISDYAMKNRQDLILAVVDRHMDISYYNMKKQEL